MDSTELSTRPATDHRRQRVDLRFVGPNIQPGRGSIPHIVAVPTSAPAPIRYTVIRLDRARGNKVGSGTLLHDRAVRAVRALGDIPEGAISADITVPECGVSIPLRVYFEQEGI